jgi:hypothetical protein
MIDVTTNKPLRLTIASTGAAYLDLPFSQLDAVRSLLDAHRVPYWVSDLIISFDSGPERATVHFAWKADLKAVQALLDEAP